MPLPFKSGDIVLDQVPFDDDSDRPRIGKACGDGASCVSGATLRLVSLGLDRIALPPMHFSKGQLSIYSYAKAEMEGYEELGFAREPRKQVRWRSRWARMRRDRQMGLLVRDVARSRRLGINLLLDDFRGAGPTFARQMAMYLAHVELGRPQKTVAFLFGREPSSVSHACARMEMLRDDPAVEAEIDGIERAFRTEAGRHAH